MRLEDEAWRREDGTGTSRRGGGRVSCSWDEWHKLVKRREDAWDTAERASDDVGIAYHDRKGVRRSADKKEKDTCLVERVLKRYCHRTFRVSWGPQ